MTELKVVKWRYDPFSIKSGKNKSHEYTNS